MSVKETGGPAFPELGNIGYNSDWQSENGMTLRDYFAAKTLPHIRTATPFQSEGNPRSPVWTADRKRWAEKVSEEAYLFADAMIAERSK